MLSSSYSHSEACRELIKTFKSTRSITTKGETIRRLYGAFPTDDPVVRESEWPIGPIPSQSI